MVRVWVTHGARGLWDAPAIGTGLSPFGRPVGYAGRIPVCSHAIVLWLRPPAGEGRQCPRAIFLITHYYLHVSGLQKTDGSEPLSVAAVRGFLL